MASLPNAGSKPLCSQRRALAGKLLKFRALRVPLGQTTVFALPGRSVHENAQSFSARGVDEALAGGRPRAIRRTGCDIALTLEPERSEQKNEPDCRRE